MNKNNGFTLVEIVLSLGIISILLIISAVEFGEILDRSKLQTTARMISNDLRYAQQLAISNKNDETKVVFDNINNRFSVVQNAITYKLTYLPENVEYDLITFTNRECKYNKRGNPTAGRVIIKSNDQYYTITVRVATGRVKIYDYRKTTNE